MTSAALYEGTVTHERRRPRRRLFTHRVIMPLVDVDRLDELTGLSPLWRAERWAPMTFRRRDFRGDPATALSEVVRDLVLERAGFRPRGPVQLLAHHRTWGWCFNPIALYFCYSEDGESLEAVVADVTNTPWGETHAYVIDARRGLEALEPQPKALHVSPFLTMDLLYRFRVGAPGGTCSFSVAISDADGTVFGAALVLRRRDLTRRQLARALLAHPLMTHRVSLAIYLHAARLWLGRVPFVAHPRTTVRS